MGKRRRRSSHDSFWTQQYGGMPVWGLAAAVAFLLAASAVAVPAALAPRSQAEARQPRPIPTMAQQESNPVTLFIGDSYSAGAGATDRSKRWTTLVSKRLGWAEVNEALGGTGYGQEASEIGCGREFCPAYPEVIETIDDPSPALIVISGGRNDSTDIDAFRTAVAATFKAVTDRFPGVEVVVTSPLWDDDDPREDIPQKRAVVADVAAGFGIRYLDLGDPLLGDAALVAADSIHPSDAGYVKIADAFVTAWDG